MPTTLTHIRKRDNRVVSFNRQKIADAIFRAAEAAGGEDRFTADELSKVVEMYLEEYFATHTPSIEDVQDVVEKVLIETNHAQTAKAYILYREERSRVRQGIKVRRDNHPISGIERSACLQDWDKSFITTQLVANGHMDTESAQAVASRVEQSILRMGLTHISRSLVRELVANALYDEGHHDALKRTQSVSLSAYEASKALNQYDPAWQSPDRLTRAMGEQAMASYALSRLFRQDVAQAHQSGELHLDGIGHAHRVHSFRVPMVELSSALTQMKKGDTLEGKRCLNQMGRTIEQLLPWIGHRLDVLDADRTLHRCVAALPQRQRRSGLHQWFAALVSPAREAAMWLHIHELDQLGSDETFDVFMNDLLDAWAACAPAVGLVVHVNRDAFADAALIPACATWLHRALEVAGQMKGKDAVLDIALDRDVPSVSTIGLCLQSLTIDLGQLAQRVGAGQLPALESACHATIGLSIDALMDKREALHRYLSDDQRHERALPGVSTGHADIRVCGLRSAVNALMGIDGVQEPAGIALAERLVAQVRQDIERYQQEFNVPLHVADVAWPDYDEAPLAMAHPAVDARPRLQSSVVLSRATLDSQGVLNQLMAWFNTPEVQTLSIQ